MTAPATVTLTVPGTRPQGTLMPVTILVTNPATMDEEGNPEPVDPEEVELVVTIGQGASTSYTWTDETPDPTDEIVRDGVGEFHADFDTTNSPGTWVVECAVTGNYQGAAVNGFVITSTSDSSGPPSPAPVVIADGGGP